MTSIYSADEFAQLPIACARGVLTMQGVIGSIVLCRGEFSVPDDLFRVYRERWQERTVEIRLDVLADIDSYDRVFKAAEDATDRDHMLVLKRLEQSCLVQPVLTGAISNTGENQGYHSDSICDPRQVGRRIVEVSVTDKWVISALGTGKHINSEIEAPLSPTGLSMMVYRRKAAVDTSIELYRRVQGHIEHLQLEGSQLLTGGIKGVRRTVCK